MLVINPNHKRQAIQTKYLGPTDTRGERVEATAWAGSKTVEWDHSLNSDDNHIEAARALAAKFGWDLYNDMAVGSAPDMSGLLVVLTPKATS